MKIIYYTDQIYLHGGIERVLANKVNYLVNNGFDVSIITTEQRGKLPCYEVDLKVETYDLGINYDRKISYYHPQNFKKAINHFFKLKKLLKQQKPDVLIVCNYAYGFYFIPFINSNLFKIKEFHSSRHFESLARNKNKSILKKIFYKANDYIESKYDYLAILNKDEKQYYKSDNILIIPNSITNFPLEISKLDSDIAISAGRLAPVKQFDILIKAWYFVIKKKPSWKLEIYGEGEVEFIKYLQKLINDYELQNHVYLCGKTKDLEKKMLKASLYILSSKTECFPMVLLEAMSCGLPVVSFDCPNGPKNIITDKVDGLLVKADDLMELANTIIILIDNKIQLKRIGRHARENIKRFQEDIIMNNWINVFNKIK